MSQKLKKEHLEPYLLYGLNCLNQHLPDTELVVEELIGISNHITWSGIFNAMHGSNHIPICGIKPILRPLSDLTKEIEINGDNFIPLFHFAKMQIANDELDRLYIETDNKTFFNCMYNTGGEDDDLVVYFDSYNILLTPYERITELLKMHFDIFGLIDAGLAIDINTLKNNES
jgi:hypothetical protein